MADHKAPVVRVIKQGASAFTYQNPQYGNEKIDYYKAKMSYEIVIQDQHLKAEEGGVAVLTYKNNDGIQTIDLLAQGTFKQLTPGLMEYSYILTVENGEMLDDLTLEIADDAENKADQVSGEGFTLSSDKTKLVHNGNAVIVDGDSPTAKMTFAGPVSGVYTNGNIAYLKLDEPEEGNSGVASKKEPVTVDVIVTVEDNNLTTSTAPADKHNSVTTGSTYDAKEWVASLQVNGSSKVTYTRRITAEPDSYGYIEWNMSIFDLTGNPAKIVIPSIEGSKVTFPVDSVAEGEFQKTISVNRRRPQTGNQDTSAPSIQAVATAAPKFNLENGVPLYSNGFDFNVAIQDQGNTAAERSGLKHIYYEIRNGGDFISSVKTPLEYNDYTHIVTFLYRDGECDGTLEIYKRSWFDNPRTGDDFNPALWGSLLAVSAVGIGAAAYFLLKKKKK